MGAGLVWPDVLIVAVLLNSLPALKSSSTTRGDTAPPPALIWNTAVCAWTVAAKAQEKRPVRTSAPWRRRERNRDSGDVEFMTRTSLEKPCWGRETAKGRLKDRQNSHSVRLGDGGSWGAARIRRFARAATAPIRKRCSCATRAALIRSRAGI